MAYITKQDLEDELGEDKLIELTNDDDNDVVNDAVINKAIEYAEGTFNSYIRTRYTLPVPSTQMVKSLCLEIAIYHLFKKRATVDEGVFKIRKIGFDEAIARLKDINAGKSALDVPATEETIDNPATADKILSGRKKPQFTDDKLTGF